jgi:hypothetical protein
MDKSEAGKLGAIASLKTHKKNKELRVEEYNKNPNKCFTCDSVLDYESRSKKFCSRSCAAKTNNIGVIRNKKNFSESCFSSSKNKEIKFKPDCLNCSKSLKKNALKFCSSSCFADYHWKIRKEKIYLNGKAEGINQAKRYLKEVRGNSCEMCGIDTWAEKPILLLCDHIDGNSSNWDLKNLRLICSNCDATTPFYKNKNKGNGRAYRRERYREGKSF